MSMRSDAPACSTATSRARCPRTVKKTARAAPEVLIPSTANQRSTGEGNTRSGAGTSDSTGVGDTYRLMTTRAAPSRLGNSAMALGPVETP